LSKNVLIKVPESIAEPPKPAVAIPAAKAFLSGNQLNKLTIGRAYDNPNPVPAIKLYPS